MQDGEPEEIEQMVLDDVPRRVRRRMPEPANTLIKEKQWSQLLAWLTDHIDDIDAITVVSPYSTQGTCKICLLGTLAGFRPLFGAVEHRQCAEIIVKTFYDAGLINLRIGRSDETALMKAVTIGNYEVAALLFEYGAGHSPCVIPFFFIRELLFGTPCVIPWREDMHCQPGDCGGEGWRLSGGARMADRRGATR